ANGRIAVSPRARSVPVETWRPRPFGEEDEAPQEPKENYVFRTSVSEAGREYAEYRIGARDLLQVVIYPSRHAEPIEETRRVEPSGELLLPVVSSTPLPIVDKDGYGLTPSQLRGQIKGKLARQVFKDPAVAVTVEKFAAHTASVLGEIRIKPNQSLTGPGQYVLRGRTRVLEFIARHGGFTGNADLTKVEVRKEDGEKRVVNLFKAVFQSKLSQDVILDRGDTVYIPSVRMSDRKVFVLGEVGDPGVYRLEDPITLVEGIQLAGSFLPSANRKQVIVIRGDRQNPTFFQINMLDILRKGDLSKNILLENADIVFVPRNWVANLREFYAWFLPSYDLVSGNR
ncbi:MAG: SLBB domain-containing protein, partial [Planctomycetota bacterium]